MKKQLNHVRIYAIIISFLNIEVEEYLHETRKNIESTKFKAICCKGWLR